jgi:methyl-accepting chemotaxis protein
MEAFMIGLKDVKMKPKLILLFLLIGLVPLSVTSWLSNHLASKTIVEGSFRQMESLREIKKAQIEKYFVERQGDIVVLAEMVKTLKNSGVNLAKTDFFKKFKEAYGYYDLFLITPDGYVFYTVAKEADYQSNLVSGKYSDSNLGILVRKVLSSGKYGLADFKPYAPSNNEPCAFIAQPVLDAEGKTEIIVALQLSLDSINQIMQQRQGMGKTGETYLVGPDFLMRSDSFLDPMNHSVKASFANPSQGSVKTEGAQEALAGKDGSKIITDYNGNLVLSSFTSLKIGEYV